MDNVVWCKWFFALTIQQQQQVLLVVRNLSKAIDMPIEKAYEMVYQMLNKPKDIWPPEWLGW